MSISLRPITEYCPLAKLIYKLKLLWARGGRRFQDWEYCNLKSIHINLIPRTFTQKLHKSFYTRRGSLLRCAKPRLAQAPATRSWGNRNHLKLSTSMISRIFLLAVSTYHQGVSKAIKALIFYMYVNLRSISSTDQGGICVSK